MTHADVELITAYVTGDAALPADAEWALEAHLEQCAVCRQQVADAVSAHAPAVSILLDDVWVGVAAATDNPADRPAPVRSRLLRALRRWAPASQLMWLLLSVLVTLAALGLDLLDDFGRTPSLVLLVAPIAPLLPVAAAWAGPLDPMSELTMATPRAGLALVLRRTAAVLVVVIPVLAAAGGLAGVSLAVCLLPGLAFTLGALALGTVLGVDRAAALLGLLWVVAVIAPSLATARLSVVLSPESLPAWVLGGVVAAAVVAVRARAFTTLR